MTVAPDLLDDDPQPAPAKRRAAPERQISTAVIRWLRLVLPECVTAVIPIEQRGNAIDAIARARYGAMRKASGILPGTPDAFTALRNGRVVWWEFKAPKGRVSDTQLALHRWFQRLDHPVCVCRSIDDARDFLERCGVAVAERGA